MKRISPGHFAERQPADRDIEVGGDGRVKGIPKRYLTPLIPKGSAVTVSFGGFAGIPAEGHAFREGGAIVYEVHVSELIPSLSYIKDFWKNVWKDIWGDPGIDESVSEKK